MKSKLDTQVAAIPPLLPMSPGRMHLAQYITNALTASHSGKDFPNFTSDELYSEAPGRHNAPQEDFEIDFEEFEQSSGVEAD